MSIKRTLKAIKVDDNYIVSIYNIALNHNTYFINGIEMERMDGVDNYITFSVNDKVEVVSKQKQIDHYQHTSGRLMTMEEYRTLNTYYDEESDEDDVLLAIKNRKIKDGFEPVYKEPKKQPVEFEIIGKLEDTKSMFIFCSLSSTYATSAPIYTLHGGKVAMDEYLLLSEEFKEHAKFEKPDRSYLRFTKINNNFVFGDSKPFGDDPYRYTFKTLEEAQAEELSIRDIVRKTVKRKVFSEEFTDFKVGDIISKLTLIKTNAKDVETYNLLNSVIADIEDYRNNLR